MRVVWSVWNKLLASCIYTFILYVVIIKRIKYRWSTKHIHGWLFFYSFSEYKRMYQMFIVSLFSSIQKKKTKTIFYSLRLNCMRDQYISYILVEVTNTLFSTRAPAHRTASSCDTENTFFVANAVNFFETFDIKWNHPRNLTLINETNISSTESCSSGSRRKISAGKFNIICLTTNSYFQSLWNIFKHLGNALAQGYVRAVVRGVCDDERHIDYMDEVGIVVGIVTTNNIYVSQ